MTAISGAHILLVEDEAKTAEWIRLYLDRAGMTVSLAADGRAALAEAARRPPNLVLLDVMLPGLSGFEVCRALRSSEVPIILLTARAAEHDRLRGFELGADDYIVKPFSPRELVARVSAVLRRTRSHGGAQGALIVGRLTHRTDALEVECEGHTVKLTPIESRLLGVLMSAPHRIFTRAELVSRVLGDDYAGSDRTIDAHVKNLRRKLDMLPSRPPAIETTHGVGYRLAARAGSDAPDA
jgi:DNA-binding response OmpR family regulator